MLALIYVLLSVLGLVVGHVAISRAERAGDRAYRVTRSLYVATVLGTFPHAIVPRDPHDPTGWGWSDMTTAEQWVSRKRFAARRRANTVTNRSRDHLAITI